MTHRYRGRKLSPEKDYMTTTETEFMKAQVEKGDLSFFRLKKCKNEKCKNEIVKSKKYCSFDCKMKVELEE